MNLAELIKSNYLTLSSGEKQRVQYARVLAQVWHTVLIAVMHDINLAALYADNLSSLKKINCLHTGQAWRHSY